MTIRAPRDQASTGLSPAPDCPVVLLHGFGQTGAAWAGVVERLAPRDCLAPDLRGHGSASLAKPIDPMSLVGDVADLASDSKPILVGYSMGGRLAIRAALSHSSLFSALVLLSTTAGIEAPDARAARRRSDAHLASLLENGDTEGFEREWQALPLWQGDPERVSTESRQLRSLSEPRGLAESLRGFGSGSINPVWDRLGEIDLPTAVLAGERDHAYSEVAARLAAGIRDCSLTIVAGCGHSIPLEQPAAVAAAVERISRRLRPGGS